MFAWTWDEELYSDWLTWRDQPQACAIGVLVDHRIPNPATRGFFFYIIIFFTQAETPYMLRFWFIILHSHISWPRSGDCEGSRIRTRDSCVLCLVSPSCLSSLSHHVPKISLSDERKLYTFEKINKDDCLLLYGVWSLMLYFNSVNCSIIFIRTTISFSSRYFKLGI
jgi:hypothetical protein